MSDEIYEDLNNIPLPTYSNKVIRKSYKGMNNWTRKDEEDKRKAPLYKIANNFIYNLGYSINEYDDAIEELNIENHSDKLEMLFYGLNKIKEIEGVYEMTIGDIVYLKNSNPVRVGRIVSWIEEGFKVMLDVGDCNPCYSLINLELISENKYIKEFIEKVESDYDVHIRIDFETGDTGIHLTFDNEELIGNEDFDDFIEKELHILVGKGFSRPEFYYDIII